MSTPKPKHLVVLGAGVTGLQTALSLLRRASSDQLCAVTIIAAHLPGERAAEYSSPWAGGHWRSHATFAAEDERIRRWDERTYRVWSEMLASEGADEKLLGLGFRTGTNFWGIEDGEASHLDGRGLWWAEVVEDFRLLSASERLDGAVMGVSYKSICVTPDVYCAFLLNECRSLGARVIKASVAVDGGLEGVVKSARSILENHRVQDDMFAFINCAGLMARHFLPLEEAERLHPISGQTVLVKGEASGPATYLSPPGTASEVPEILYVIPRPSSGTSILGGSKGLGDWSVDEDASLTNKILAGVRRFKMAESIVTDEGFEVLSVQVGSRPGRIGGARVEVEGTVDGVWMIHSYGHAGGGYQESIGCAEEVVEMVIGLAI